MKTPRTPLPRTAYEPYQTWRLSDPTLAHLITFQWHTKAGVQPVVLVVRPQIH